MIKTDEKVFKKLHVTNSKQLFGEPLKKLISMQNKIDPAVLSNLINQIPEFSKNMKEVLDDAKGLIEKAMEENRISSEHFYTICEMVLSPMGELLKNESLDFDQKRDVMDRMQEIVKLAYEADKANKGFLRRLVDGFLENLPLILLGGGAVIGFSIYNNISDSESGESYEERDEVA